MSAERSFRWNTAVAVTPDDNNDLATPWAVGVNVAAAGDVAWHDYDGVAQEPVFVEAGVDFPLPARRILSTGTAATGITALKIT